MYTDDRVGSSKPGSALSLMSGLDESDVPGRPFFFLGFEPEPEPDGVKRNAGEDGLRGDTLGDGGALAFAFAERLLLDEDVGARVW